MRACSWFEEQDLQTWIVQDNVLIRDVVGVRTKANTNKGQRIGDCENPCQSRVGNEVKQNLMTLEITKSHSPLSSFWGTWSLMPMCLYNDSILLLLLTNPPFPLTVSAQSPTWSPSTGICMAFQVQGLMSPNYNFNIWNQAMSLADDWSMNEDPQGQVSLSTPIIWSLNHS